MKRIVLVWPYHRKDWIHIFHLLEQDFEFHYLAYIHEKLDTAAERPARVHYWSDFGDAKEIIDNIKPDKIVFMSIDSGLSIALNITAKQNNVSTYVLQHGVFTNYRDYRIRERLWKKTRVRTQATEAKADVGFSSLRFIRNSVSNPYLLARILVHAYITRKQGIYYANRHFSFEGKKPDFYICFSKANGRIYEELDNPKESRFIYTGSPELDTYLIRDEQAPVQGRYILHIDQAMAENSFGEETVSKQDMIGFYNKLNVLARKHDAKLFVKLHPESFGATWLPQDGNITYLERVPDLKRYVQHAFLCTGFYSTLVIPAAYWKRLILFSINYSFIQETLSAIPRVLVIPFGKFDPANTALPTEVHGPDESLKSYFYSFDGRSIERIKNVLND